jgi:hypothetical protein
VDEWAEHAAVSFHHIRPVDGRWTVSAYTDGGVEEMVKHQPTRFETLGIVAEVVSRAMK